MEPPWTSCVLMALVSLCAWGRRLSGYGESRGPPDGFRLGAYANLGSGRPRRSGGAERARAPARGVGAGARPRAPPRPSRRTRNSRSLRRCSGISSASCSLRRRRDHAPDTVPLGGQRLLLEPADRQHLAGQRDLAGHRHVRTDGPPGQQRGRAPSPSRRRRSGRPWASRRPGRGCGCRASRTSRRASSGTSSEALLRTYDSAACADSCITSPSWPVIVRCPAARQSRSPR